MVEVTIVSMYKLNKTTSITERAFPWKHKAGSFVHEEPRSKRKCEVRYRGRVATVLVMMKVHYKRTQNSRTLAFAVAFVLCSYRLT